ncbi:uncharacterized protein C3orf38 homolog [Amblyraja radiata]|uniref:uncharacterized protein C3orf38 homolog n=1 Tax=Amblyraja radiata TaxID=386614 RepID=UPI001401C057|nr:uncharacterized protein C3orf38 homolog [Amblyraja radiata]
MSHFSFTQRSGCSEILELLDFSNLMALKDTVASKINAWTYHEAIRVILTHSQSAEELLKRKKVLRESILKYLIKHDETVSTSSSKPQLIGDVLHYWWKLDWNRKHLTAEKELQVSDRKRTVVQNLVTNAAEEKRTPLPPIITETREFGKIRQTEEQERKKQAKKSEEQSGGQTDVPILKQPHDQMKIKMNIHVNILPSQQPPQVVTVGGSESGDMGKEFCQWFFHLLNSQNPSFGQQAEAWGPQHFWDDAMLHFTHCVRDIQTEQHQSSAIVSRRLLSLVKDEQLLFNPNISHSGMRSATSPYGVVAIAVAGTVHKEGQCLGIFEQVFGLIRSAVCGNNWKIRFVKLQVKAFNGQQQIVQPSVSVQMPELQAYLNEFSSFLK